MIEYQSTPDFYNEYISHHGILGMKWHVKNGPPYPLSREISTGSRLKEGAKGQGSISKKNVKSSGSLNKNYNKKISNYADNAPLLVEYDPKAKKIKYLDYL